MQAQTPLFHMYFGNPGNYNVQFNFQFESNLQTSAYFNQGLGMPQQRFYPGLQQYEPRALDQYQPGNYSFLPDSSPSYLPNSTALSNVEDSTSSCLSRSHSGIASNSWSWNPTTASCCGAMPNQFGFGNGNGNKFQSYTPSAENSTLTSTPTTSTPGCFGFPTKKCSIM